MLKAFLWGLSLLLTAGIFGLIIYTILYALTLLYIFTMIVSLFLWEAAYA